MVAGKCAGDHGHYSKQKRMYTPSQALDMVGKFAVWPHIPRKPCPPSLAYQEGTEKT